MGGLSFLNSGLLLFTAATILPLLIWLLAKKKPKRVVFPSLRFIKAGLEQEKKRSRLKNIILLIIRMLIILLVTLAATRPLLQSKHLKPSRKHPPTAIALVLDTSFSMDYVSEAKTTLDRAREALRRINALCEAQDRLVLVTSDEAWNRLHAQIYAGSIPDDLIARLEVCFTPMSVDAMLSLAQDKLRETQLSNREMYYLTDGQTQPLDAELQSMLNVINLSPEENRENLSCSEATVLPQLVEKTRRQTIQFKLTNHGGQDVGEALVKVVLDGAKIAEKFVSVPARQSINQSIVIDISKDGWQNGYVEVLDDRLTHDNRSYFSFPFRLAPRIAVFSGSLSVPPHLSSLLSVYAGSGGKVDILGPQQLSLAALEQYETLVFIDPGVPATKLRELIKTLGDKQRGALFCLGADSGQDYRSVLSDMFGVALGTLESKPQSVSYVNPHHYTTELIAGKNVRYNQIGNRWKVSGTGSTILLGGSPDQFSLAKGNMLLWNFDLEDQRATFLLDASFAVFAYRSLEYAGAVLSAGEKYALGDIVRASAITLPDGKRLELASRSHKIVQPGIYTLLASDGSDHSVAVDVPESESAFVPMDYTKQSNVRVLGKNWQNTIFHTRLGHDLWKILLAAALALIVLEIVLVKTEELRPSASAANQAHGSKS